MRTDEKINKLKDLLNELNESFSLDLENQVCKLANELEMTFYLDERYYRNCYEIDEPTELIIFGYYYEDGNGNAVTIYY